MIRAILAAFATTINSEMGLSPRAAKPVFGAPVATVPLAAIAVTGFGPGEDERISQGAQYGRALTATLFIFATSDAAMLDYLDSLNTLYGTGALMVSGVEVSVRWAAAVLPEPDAEMDKTLWYQIQQPITFTWEA